MGPFSLLVIIYIYFFNCRNRRIFLGNVVQGKKSLWVTSVISFLSWNFYCYKTEMWELI